MTQDLDAFVAALPMAILVIGQGDRILALNASAQALLPVASVGSHYVTALRQPAVLEVVDLALRRGQAGQTGFTGPGDSQWRATVRRAGQNVVLTCEDMTAQEDAERVRRDFIANVSHEMRTPLTALIGFIETLQGPARDDPVARDRFLTIMAAEAGRMGRLVEDLLSLRQVEDQERVRPTGPVNLGALVDSVVRTLGPMAERAGVRVLVERPAVLPDIPGDAGQLQQVLTNLLDNAIKYGAAGGQVTVGLAGPADEPDLQGPGLRLWVADQGDGIATHHLGRLTERFYRIDTHRSRAVGGTGLGLAIVKHIVTRHRGRLRIDSAPGRGSRFTVILPAS